MKRELNNKYNHLEVEEGKYNTWVEKGYFTSGDKEKEPFSIVIPPPNVTGKLHLGHAWNTTLQDIIIRYKRMNGFDALWLPGMDHAGIATQAKVEQKMRENGINKYEIGREKFLEKAWEWKAEYAETIHKQWAKMGLSLDYTKERFTLDAGLNEAVKKVFVTLYEKGYLYRGEKIINWDPMQKTALSNIEVIYKETKSCMYYFKYNIVGEDDYLEVATTRPETMFGDVCVVVNPEDEKFKKYIGKKVINPANGEELPIIADEYVEIGFGTGAMKCTPAHDPNDFILGEKYGFPHPIIMNPDGTINEHGHKYCGMDRFECRKQLVEDLKNQGLVIKIDDNYVNQVGYSERSNAIVEPYLSKQWFVIMKPLAEAAINYQNSEEKINFFPERFEKTLNQWMTNIEDWCVSRQLWWGHRIPAWYKKDNLDEVYVGINPPENIDEYVQDEDVLDTWFSSALWPFSTLGWPNDNEDLKRYYPTSVLVTAYDIIFFWVARMVFQGIEFTKEKPFKHVLIHGLIRDAQGRKMSKSLGNGIDPMDVIDKYGVDSLRYFLTTNSAPGQDLRFSTEKVESSWNFINKIWNASRFTLMNLPEDYKFNGINEKELSIADKWILNRLNSAIYSINENMEKYEFGVASTYMYNFIWNDFCSWYIELAKLGLNSDSSTVRKSTYDTLFYVLDAITKLIHPFMPFVSEEIYQALHGSKEVTITTSSWPKIDERFNEKESTMDLIQDIITNVRATKNEYNLAPSKPIDIIIRSFDDNNLSLLEDNRKYLERFTFANTLEFINDNRQIDKCKTIILTNLEVFIPLSGMINIEEEIKNLTNEINKLTGEIKRCEGMLNNPNFLNKAPEAKVNEERAKLENYKSKMNIAKERLEAYKNQ